MGCRRGGIGGSREGAARQQRGRAHLICKLAVTRPVVTTWCMNIAAKSLRRTSQHMSMMMEAR